MLEGVPVATTAINRKNRFLEGMENHPDIEVISAVGNYSRAGADRAIERVMEESRRFDAIFAHNDVKAAGVRIALGALGLIREAFPPCHRSSNRRSSPAPYLARPPKSKRMQFRVIGLAFVLAFAAPFVLPPVHPATGAVLQNDKRVLLVSSYHPSFPSFFRQIEGIRTAFAERGYGASNLVFDVEFMDSKRHPEPEQIERFRDLLAYRLKDRPAYDVVLASDDNALKFVLANHASLFANQPVVFLGINNRALADSLNANPRVTGVVEAISMAETLRTVERLLPKAETLAVVAAANRSGRLNLKTFEANKTVLKHMSAQILSLDELSFADLAARLRDLPDRTAILLLSAIRDRTGATLTYHDSLGLLLKNTDAPIFSLWAHGLGHGVLGGKIVSHFEQGRVAAEKAAAILQGTDPKDLDVVGESPNVFIFDHTVMTRHGIAASALPEGSQILNEPTDYLEAYRAWLPWVLIFIVVQSAIIVALVVSNRRRKAAERRAVDSESEFKDFAEASVDWFWKMDKDLRFTFVSDRYFELTGVDRSRVIGHTREEMIGTDHEDIASEKWQAHLRQVHHHEPYKRFEYATTAKDNRVIYIAVSGVPIFDDAGTFAGYRGTGTDITQRKLADEAMIEADSKIRGLYTTLEAAQRIAGLGSWSWDIASDRIEWSDEMYAIFGRERGVFQPTLENLLETIHADDRSVLQTTLNQALNNDATYEVEYRLVRPDGSERHVHARAEVVRDADGFPVTMIGAAHDITERKRAEREIREFNRTLERRVAERTRELRQAQSSLVEAEKMASLGNLVAGVAHEINTPVGVSMTASTNLLERTAGFVELYRQGRMKRSDLEGFVEIADESCRILDSNLHRASDLIQSFKQVAVDQTDDATRQINLNDYVEEVLLSLKPELKTTEVSVEVDMPSDIVLDIRAGALSQVLTNLVVNSLVHGYDSGMKGRIRIAAHTESGQVILDYSDDGKGMAPDVVERIFEPFFTTQRGSGGSGLGMHLLYNLVTQSLEGRVTCTSEPGQGTAFRIEFPSRNNSNEEVGEIGRSTG